MIHKTISRQDRIKGLSSEIARPPHPLCITDRFFVCLGASAIWSFGQTISHDLTKLYLSLEVRRQWVFIDNEHDCTAFDIWFSHRHSPLLQRSESFEMGRPTDAPKSSFLCPSFDSRQTEMQSFTNLEEPCNSRVVSFNTIF